MVNNLSTAAVENQHKAQTAHTWAKAELAKRHPAEFQKLVDFYRQQLGLPPAQRNGHSSRPAAPTKL